MKNKEVKETKLTPEEAIKEFESELRWAELNTYPYVSKRKIEADKMAIKALGRERMSEWIPIKTRPMTNEEKEKYRSMGWDDKRIEFMYDCQLPDDGQTVLVTDRLGFVSEDTFYNDDGCYFESNCDMNDIKAWMPLPSPYNAESEEK